MHIYYNAGNNTVYIDQSNRITTIPMQKGLDPIEAAYLIKSSTMRTIIEQLTDRRAPS